jgi:hypothetical protein
MTLARFAAKTIFGAMIVNTWCGYFLWHGLSKPCYQK